MNAVFTGQLRPTRMTVKQIAEAVRAEAMTLEQAHDELRRRQDAGQSIDAVEEPYE